MSENSGQEGTAEPVASSISGDFLKDAKLFIEEQKKSLLKLISNVQESYGNFTSKLCDSCRTAQPDSLGSGEFLEEINRFTDEQTQALQNGGSAAQDSCTRLRSNMCNICKTVQPDSNGSGDFLQEINRFTEEQRQALQSGGSAAQDSFGKLRSGLFNIFNGAQFAPAQPVALTEEQVQEALVAETKKRADLTAVYEDIMRSVTEEKEEEQSRKNVATEREEKEKEYNKKLVGEPVVDEAMKMMEIAETDDIAATVNETAASIVSSSNITAPSVPIERVADLIASAIPAAALQPAGKAEVPVAAPAAVSVNVPTVASIVAAAEPNVKDAVGAVTDIATSILPASFPTLTSTAPTAPAVSEAVPMATPIVSSG